MKRLGLLFLVLLAGCITPTRYYDVTYRYVLVPPSPPHGQSVGAVTVVGRASIAAGTSGTVTVGAGKYVLNCSAFGTGAGTLTVTPCGPAVTGCTAQPAITLPANTSYTYAPTGAPNSVADGSTLVFAGTSAYACTIWQYNP